VDDGRVTLGLIILTLGALMLVNRADIFDFNVMVLFPGVLLIALGLVRLAFRVQACDARRRSHPVLEGLWLMTVGAWLIVNFLHLFGLTFATSWPLLLIAGGAFIVARALDT
jgi:hypothetical protein